MERTAHSILPLVAGRFGFQKEMNALNSLGAGENASTDGENVTALLRSTKEVERRVQVNSTY